MAWKSVRKRPFEKASKQEAKPAVNGYLVSPARAACCEEAASGGRRDRPELHHMLDQLRNGDTVVVWRRDRLSRSLKDVLHIMERIADAGAGFRSVTENIDTTTLAGA